jgi:hypothetical protein
MRLCTIEELCSIATPYFTYNEATELCLAQGNREAPPSSGKETPSIVAVHSTKEGTKGGKKRCKQRPQGAMTMIDHDDGGYEKVGGSRGGRVVTAARSDKHQARLPMDHFKRLPEEACPNHAYPVRNKLKDYNMMKSFMISGSLTQGTKLNEDSGGSDTMPFPGEDTVMMVYGGHPHQGGTACLP